MTARRAHDLDSHGPAGLTDGKVGTGLAGSADPGSGSPSPALRSVRARTAFVPEVGLVLGSGLDALAEAVETAFAADYRELPGFPESAVAGHAGRLLLGRLEGRRVAVLRGRVHVYEGHDPRDVAAGVRLLDELGARVLVLTNAAGVVSRRFEPGDLMVIEDHLNLMWGSPLVGRAAGEVKDMFPDMSQPYDRALRRRLLEAALEKEIPCAEGVYAAVQGPSYETPAEVEMLRRAGADAVGMSTVPEVIAARERRLLVAGISCLTNRAAGPARRPLRHADVLAEAERAGPRLERLVRRFLRELPEERAGGGQFLAPSAA